MPCRAGTIAPRRGLRKCRPCPAGKMTNPRRTKCINKPKKKKKKPCRAGFFGKGGAYCRPCPKGMFTANPGRRKCKRCPAGKIPNPKRTGCIKKKKCAKKGTNCANRPCCAGRRCRKVKGVKKCV